MTITPAFGDILPSTYSAESTTVGGGQNKNMLGVFNPLASGVIAYIRRIWLLESSGLISNNVAFQVRRSSAQSGGTLLTAAKHHTGDPDATLIASSGPASIVDTGLIYSDLLQGNTGRVVLEMLSDIREPIVLLAGEGIYFQEVTASISLFIVGCMWTEE